MRLLAPCFAVDIYAHTILSNHFHLVLRHDPLAHRDWTDDEVAWRWLEAFPPTEGGAVVEELKPERRNSCSATRSAWRAPAAPWGRCRTS